MARLTPDQERAWQRECAERKARELTDELQRLRLNLIEALTDGGVSDATMIVIALDEYLDARSAK